MDATAFFKLSYGLYIVSSTLNGKDAGCVVNTVQQVTNAPNQLSVSVNKDNYTSQIIKESGKFAASVLLADADMDIIRLFGFQSSKNTDKFAAIPHLRDQNGVAYPENSIAARFSCQVKQVVDVGTHLTFIGEVVAAETLSAGEVMTYAYYHKVKNGVTPPKASSYQPPAGETGWRCSVCGHIHKEVELPENFVCPICGQPASVFQKM